MSPSAGWRSPPLLIRERIPFLLLPDSTVICWRGFISTGIFFKGGSVSNFQAIRGVTETLRTLLSQQMEGKGVVISAGPPDLQPKTKVKRLNLFLYKVTENPYLKDQEIPGQGHPGAYGKPPLSLVLYYLLTAFPDQEDYNKDFDLTAHELMGDAMRVFHDFPILTDTLENPPGSGIKLLHTSLRNQFEKVKIVLQPLDTEELTKIWMAFNAPYRLSAGYEVSVVQIESQRPRQMARPVKTRRVHAVQIRRPQVTDLSVKDPADLIKEMPPYAVRIGDQVTLEGSHFVDLSTQVVLGGLKIPVTPDSSSLIRFGVPDDPKLQPGPQPMGVTVKRATEVVQGGSDDRGETASGELFVASNQVAVMVVPKITVLSPVSGNPDTILSVKGVRLFKEDLKAFVLVGDTAIQVRKPGDSDPWSVPSSTEVQVSLKALASLAKGKYTVRVRVNGAESLEEDKEFDLT
jgi:hypothetical protein